MIGAPAISVIVPTKNRHALLHQQLAAVLAQTADVDFEVVVVDNGSTDATSALLARLAADEPRLRAIVATDMADAAYARNVGAAAARGHLLAFVDDDDLVAPGWLAAVASALQYHQIVAPRIDYSLLNRPEVVDGWPLTQARSLRMIDGVAACTGHFGIHAALWRQLNGQRTGFLVGEDMEISIRANRLLGVVPFYEPGAVYHRRLPTTLGGCFRQGRRDGRGRVQWAIDRGQRLPRREDLQAMTRMYWWLLSRAPLAALGRRRYLWALHFGERLGRLEQSLKSRVLMP